MTQMTIDRMSENIVLEHIRRAFFFGSNRKTFSLGLDVMNAFVDVLEQRLNWGRFPNYMMPYGYVDLLDNVNLAADEMIAVDTEKDAPKGSRYHAFFRGALK